MESVQSKISVSAMTAYFGIFKGEYDFMAFIERIKIGKFCLDRFGRTP
jgi:hypothetical protein